MWNNDAGVYIFLLGGGCLPEVEKLKIHSTVSVQAWVVFKWMECWNALVYYIFQSFPETAYKYPPPSPKAFKETFSFVARFKCTVKTNLEERVSRPKNIVIISIFSLTLKHLDELFYPPSFLLITFNLGDCVPFPAPGGPNNTARIPCRIGLKILNFINITKTKTLNSKIYDF